MPSGPLALCQRPVFCPRPQALFAPCGEHTPPRGSASRWRNGRDPIRESAFSPVPCAPRSRGRGPCSQPPSGKVVTRRLSPLLRAAVPGQTGGTVPHPASPPLTCVSGQRHLAPAGSRFPPFLPCASEAPSLCSANPRSGSQPPTGHPSPVGLRGSAPHAVPRRTPPRPLTHRRCPRWRQLGRVPVGGLWPLPLPLSFPGVCPGRHFSPRSRLIPMLIRSFARRSKVFFLDPQENLSFILSFWN